MSFYTSLTGLNAATAQLAVTSNNIANVGTTGFKRSRADFGDIFATSPLQKASSVVGQGVALKAVTQEFSQGNVQFSANSLDIAITGDGFFPLKTADGLQDIYTRNGTFSLDDSFAVVNSAGQALMAATVDSSGKADLENLRKLYIPRATSGEARQTEAVQLALNLPADSPVIKKAFDPSDPTTYSLTTAVTVFDSGGNDYLATVYYVKTQVASPDYPANKWQTHVYIGNTELEEKLIQASDSKGNLQYVNKYGEIRSEGSVPPVPLEKIARGVSRLFNIDDLRGTSPSVSAETKSFPALSESQIASWKAGITGSAMTEGLKRVLDFSKITEPSAPVKGTEYSLSVGSGVAIKYTAAENDTWEKVAQGLKAKLSTMPEGSKRGDNAPRIEATVTGSTIEVTFNEPETWTPTPGSSAKSVPSNVDIVLSDSQSQTLLKNLDGLKFTINIDGSEREIDATSLMFGENVDKKYTGVEIARALTNKLVSEFGGQRYFDLESLVQPSGKARLFSVAVLDKGQENRDSSDFIDIEIDKVGLGEGRDLSKVTISEIEAKIAEKIRDNAPQLGSLVVKYDPVKRSFNFLAEDGKEIFVKSGTGSQNELFDLPGTEIPVDEDGFYGADTPPNGVPILGDEFQRYGMKVEFDDFNKVFTVSSGSYGDTSSVSISAASDLMAKYFRFPPVGSSAITTDISPTPLRGIPSQPAVLTGGAIGLNVTGKFAVDNTNNRFVVTVDNVSGVVEMPSRSDYTIDSFRSELERRINSLADSQGRTVNGVTVDVARNPLGQSFFKLTTGTTGDDAFIKISGNSVWGLSGSEGARGATSKWISPPQATEIGPDGSARPLYVDRDGNETTSSEGYDEGESLDLWAPIFFDKGELTFDTAGNLISPMSAISFKPETIGDTGATLSFSINYGGSTQYTNPFSVLAQSQDGSPEGDLIGLDIGDGGLVSANYSNGTQKNLAKIVLANFSAPTGLRQIGEASYLATSQSGQVRMGEPGTAGFGTIRAGARERANVDLTQELIELISSQRNFQANAKAIETNNTLTQSIINIRS